MTKVAEQWERKQLFQKKTLPGKLVIYIKNKQTTTTTDNNNNNDKPALTPVREVKLSSSIQVLLTGLINNT